MLWYLKDIEIIKRRSWTKFHKKISNTVLSNENATGRVYTSSKQDYFEEDTIYLL